MKTIIFLILLCSSFFSMAQYTTTNSEPLDAILHEQALKALQSHRKGHQTTGKLYNVTLPPHLSPMKLSYVRLRSKTLWKKGANFSSFQVQIPPRTLPRPYVKRIIILFQDLGNLSSLFYHQDLVSPVVGFTVYDASNPTTISVRKLDLNLTQTPISVRFQDLGFRRGVECVSLGGSNGEVFLGELGGGSVCYARGYGRFAVVVMRRKRRVWARWGVGFGTVGLVGVVGLVVVTVAKGKKTGEMEKEADESVDLETVWIGFSKMPYATVTRTHPNLENAGL